MAKKTYWRCPVCGDLHYGAAAPEFCPTCHTPGAQAINITKEEFIKLASK